MKIAVCSDLHLEFGPVTFLNGEEADVLVLSGDIIVSNALQDRFDFLTGLNPINATSDRFHNFFRKVCKDFKHVVYVAGNHEFYHDDFMYAIGRIKKNLDYLENLHILDNECITIEDVTFIGGTLWTDFNKEDGLTMYHVSSRMNDFQVVKNSKRGQLPYGGPPRFDPMDALEEHKNFKEYIRLMIEGKFDKKFVVSGHHAPSNLSTHPRYKDDTLMNGAYSSDLSEFILDHPQIKLWTHGHTHEKFDYTIGETRIVCNPRGYYGFERKSSEFNLEIVEV